MTSDDVRNEARFEDSVGVFPEFIDGYNILILPTTGRYFQVRGTYWKFHENINEVSGCNVFENGLF